MLLQIPKVLDAAQLAAFRERLDGAGWADGRLTAGHARALLGHPDRARQEELAQQVSIVHRLQYRLVLIEGHSGLFVIAYVQGFSPFYRAGEHAWVGRIQIVQQYV